MKFSVIASVVALFAQCNAKLNLIHVDSTSTPFLVSDIYAAHKFATGEDLVVDSPGGGQQLAVTNPSAVTQIKLKSQLSPECSSKLCSMFQYALVRIDSFISSSISEQPYFYFPTYKIDLQSFGSRTEQGVSTPCMAFLKSFILLTF